jgi:predicted alpha/beta superfamily hydrolase
MNRRLLNTVLFVLFISAGNVFAQIPKAACGKIVHIDKFASNLVEPRNIDIWLPDGYDSGKKYSVLYMHDGQNIYDTTMTWNKQAWNVDDCACKLLKEGKLKDLIVVGIWNSPQKRHSDYFPQKPFESLTTIEKDSIFTQLKAKGLPRGASFLPNSDNYLKFIVTELKPFVDKNYSVYADMEHTFMSGSSMGGLISIYAICEYPGVFSGVACLSTHWLGTFDPQNPFPAAFVNYMKNNLPDPARHKIYFDHGDLTLDASYPPFQSKVDETMKSKGYTQKNWETLVFKGHDHSEKSWRGRFEIPLLFLLGK